MVKLSSQTRALLARIEDSIDPAVEEDYLAQWDGFLDHRFPGDIFRPRRLAVSAAPWAYRDIPINRALEDRERMLVSQMEGVLRCLRSGEGPLNVRANYGSAIVPSLFGGERYIMPEETNTLPTVRPLGAASLGRLLDAGIPSLDAGFGGDVFAMGEFYREVFAQYPKIGKYVNVYHPDAQGPLDICEVVLGSGMFYLIYDDPEGLQAFLRLVTDTYIAFLEKWYELFPPTPGRSTHWGLMHKGNIVLRDDSAMNLSPASYREFALPYDGELLRHFGGGIVHFCGRGDHYIEDLTAIPELTGINLSQPELNDREKIYRCTVDRGIPILSYPAAWAERDRARGFHGNLHA